MARSCDAQSLCCLLSVPCRGGIAQKLAKAFLPEQFPQATAESALLHDFSRNRLVLDGSIVCLSLSCGIYDTGFCSPSN